jgi:phosphoglycerate dehydrogenase-like enzyme
MKKYKIAILDDYQNVALESADWSVLRDRADIAVFQNHLADPDAVIERLLPFDIVCVMRERTALPRNIIERLPNLKLIASTGSGNASIDVAAAGEHGIAVVYTGVYVGPHDRIYLGADLGLRATYCDGEQLRPIRRLAANSGHGSPRKDPRRSGTWADWIRGREDRERFRNESDCLEPEHDPRGRQAAGALLVSKDQLFARADILTIHLVLSSRTRGLVGDAELERMKPTALLINASRGPIIEEQALISAVKNKRIAGAAIDVFDIEPLPSSHPFRTLDNVLATPHIGYVSHGLYKTFYEDTVSNIRKWIDTH